jgi:Putative zinc-finger
MDHPEAINSNSVERYLLGELAPTQRDAFEEHFFECMECAADVKAGAIFIDNTREALRTSATLEIVAAPTPAPSPGWFGWLRPAFAMALLAVLVATVGYQNFVTIPQMKREVAVNSPQALPTFSLTSASRGASDQTEIAVRRNAPFGIYVDIPNSDKFKTYSCEVRTRRGNRKLNITVSAAQAKDAVQLFIPGGTLDPGEYDVVVLGEKPPSGTEEVLRHGFVVKELP